MKISDRVRVVKYGRGEYGVIYSADDAACVAFGGGLLACLRAAFRLEKSDEGI